MPTPVPVTEGILGGDTDHPHLIGSRCLNCGNHMFPVQSGCPRCTAEHTETVALGSRGTLWTWTVQAFPPKAPPYLGPTDPATFEPFGVGYVELPGELRIEGRLTEADPAKLRIGMEMELVVVPLGVDAAGDRVVTFGFRPVDAAQSVEGRR